ncbi:MAG: hypothetical protein GQ564_00735 [Bacteroidales bacterium]|nr:hypothetical protein [Bacteroidales bacterium]
MKITKNLILGIFFVLCFRIISMGQEVSEEYPKAKPIVKVYANYHFGLNNYTTKNAFDLTRAYLGYNIKMSEHFSFKTNLDIGKPTSDSKYDYVAYLKTAELKYHKNKITVHAGLIGLKQFKLQEKNWGYRYIYKSFQDEHKYGPSADQGIMIEYQLADNLLIDATLRNGEGYKKKQSDNTYNGALGLTYNIGDNFTLRGYYEYAEKAVSQSVFSSYAGYHVKDLLNLGVEYNYMQNSSFIKDQNLMGYSAYMTYILNEKYQLFGRYDNVSSNKLADDLVEWNQAKDGEAIIAGLQYKLEKNIKISTNLQYWSSNEPGSENEIFMYVNLEYKF